MGVTRGQLMLPGDGVGVGAAQLSDYFVMSKQQCPAVLSGPGHEDMLAQASSVELLEMQIRFMKKTYLASLSTVMN